MIKLITKCFLLFFISTNCLAQIENTQKLDVLQKRGSMFYWNGSPYTGQAIDFDGVKYDKTKLRFDGHYINGQPNGRIKKWFPNHKLEYEENYLMGVKDGSQYYYFEDGKKKSEYAYLAGEMADGAQSEWDQNGNLLTQRIYQKGIMIKELDYDNGVLSNTLEMNNEYHSNGQKKSEGWIKNGKKDKHWIEWYNNGQKKSEGEYKDGNMDGKWSELDENGNLITNFYRNGEIDFYATAIVKNFMKDKTSNDFSGLYKYLGKQGNPNRLVYLNCIFKNEDAKKYLYNNNIISESDANNLIKISKADYDKYADDTVFYFLDCKTLDVKTKTSERNEYNNMTLYNCYEVQIFTNFSLKNIKGIEIFSYKYDWEYDTDGGPGRPKINRYGRNNDLYNNLSFTRYYSRQVIGLIDNNEFTKTKK